MATVLLTGVTGYIARHIARDLLEAGHTVRGSLRSPSRGDEVRGALRPALTDPAALDNLSFVSLDLSDDAGWVDAARGADVVLHTASPFPMTQPKNADDLIRPAVDGALRALNAAREAGVGRVVLTSSTAAIGNTDPTGAGTYDESCWTDLDRPGLSAYVRSKTLAERAAWEFVAGEGTGLDLTVVNPGFVVGPPLGGSWSTSVKVIERILRHRDPMLPRMGFSSVDVRDVSALHLAAMDDPGTVGLRIMAVERFLWFRDIAQAIKAAYPDRRVTTRVAPDVVVRLLSVFDPAIRSILPDLGRVTQMDNSRARQVLGRPLRSAEDGAVETAKVLIETHGL